MTYLIAATGLPSTKTTLASPQGIAFSPNGTFSVSDNTNHVVRTMTLVNNFAQTAVAATSAPLTFTLMANIADSFVAPALIGAGGGALLGRSIDRGNVKCR